MVAVSFDRDVRMRRVIGVLATLVPMACRAPLPSEPGERIEWSAAVGTPTFEVYQLFAATLIHNAVRGASSQQLSLWIMVLRFGELPDVPAAERAIIDVNAARYFQTLNTQANRLVADELYARAAEVPEWREIGDRERSALWARDHRPMTRHALALCDWPVRGARILLDAREVCIAPCVVPVPVDGRSHELRIEWEERSIVYDWDPDYPRAFPPWIEFKSPTAGTSGVHEIDSKEDHPERARDCLLDAKEDRCVNP